MDIFGILSMVAGLALFLYGMNTMGDGLENFSGGKLEKALEKMTSSTLKGFLLGTLVTAIIQSSSATTVMVVGFINSGIMKLRQGVGVIIGANLGTVMTSWILSLTGIEGDTLWLQLLKPTSFSAVLALLGIVFHMFFNSESKKNLGSIFLGFAVLMYGMDMMSDAVAPLADNPTFTGFLTLFNNPIFGIFAGLILTAIIQSSSASIGILQAISTTGTITCSMALPIVLGQNIGTCVTALISCIGAKKNAKRAAFVHLYYNIIGVTLFCIVFYGVNAFMQFQFMDKVVNQADIAIIHTIFNLFEIAVLLPLNKVLEKLACLTIRDKDEESDTPFIDERFLNIPAIATEQCTAMAVKMATKSYDAITSSFALINDFDEKTALKLKEEEEKIDRYEDVLGSYLVKLSTKNLSVSDSCEVARILHCINDFERISDHAVNIMTSAKELYDKKLSFSDQAKSELKVLIGALNEVLEITTTAFQNNDVALAENVEPLEEVVDKLSERLKNRHIKRLQAGTCTIEMGFILTDIITSCERVSDHCSNVAVNIIQLSKETFETHEYLNSLKSEDGGKYAQKYEDYLVKYDLPKSVKA